MSPAGTGPRRLPRRETAATAARCRPPAARERTAPGGSGWRPPSWDSAPAPTASPGSRAGLAHQQLRVEPHPLAAAAVQTERREDEQDDEDLRPLAKAGADVAMDQRVGA